MRLLRAPVLIIPVLLVAAARAPLRAQDTATSLTLARVLTADSTLQQPASFSFTFAADTFTVTASGVVTRSGADSVRFALPLPAGSHLERLYFGRVDGDLLLAWESNAGEGGSSTLGRYDPASFNPRWLQQLATMNTAPPLLMGTELYVGGLDFLARLDAASGDFVWQKTMLTPRGTRAFQAFGSVVLEGGTVVFTEDLRGRPGRVLRASRQDGALQPVR